MFLKLPKIVEDIQAECMIYLECKYLLLLRNIYYWFLSVVCGTALKI